MFLLGFQVGGDAAPMNANVSDRVAPDADLVYFRLYTIFTTEIMERMRTAGTYPSGTQEIRPHWGRRSCIEGGWLCTGGFRSS